MKFPGFILGELLYKFGVGFIEENFLYCWIYTPSSCCVYYLYILERKNSCHKEYYGQFVESDALWGGSEGAEYVRKEITNPVDKDYLVYLFNNEYELEDVKCGCPCDNIKVVFETEETVYAFGVGVL